MSLWRKSRILSATAIRSPHIPRRNCAALSVTTKRMSMPTAEGASYSDSTSLTRRYAMCRQRSCATSSTRHGPGCRCSKARRRRLWAAIPISTSTTSHPTSRRKTARRGKPPSAGRRSRLARTSAMPSTTPRANGRRLRRRISPTIPQG